MVKEYEYIVHIGGSTDFFNIFYFHLFGHAVSLVGS